MDERREREREVVDATGIHEFIIMNGIIYFIICLIIGAHEQARRKSEISLSLFPSACAASCSRETVRENAESSVNSIEDKINKYSAIQGKRERETVRMSSWRMDVHWSSIFLSHSHVEERKITFQHYFFALPRISRHQNLISYCIHRLLSSAVYFTVRWTGKVTQVTSLHYHKYLNSLWRRKGRERLPWTAIATSAALVMCS